MITEQDVLGAIAECQGQRNPSANTAIKLAAFYIILDHIRTEDRPVLESASYAPGPSTIQYDGQSEFASAVNGKEPSRVLKIMDELMDALSVLNPRLYSTTLQELQE